MITWNDFEKVEMRVGKIIKVEDFPEAKNPSYKLKIDFGKLGVKQSSAQITKLYSKKELLGKQVVCVVNFQPKQIANFLSAVLVMGLIKEGSKEVILLQPEREAELGLKVA